MHVVEGWACINIWLIGNQRILELDIVSAKIECIYKIFNKTLSKLRLKKYAFPKVVLSFLFSGVILTQGDVLLKSWCRTFLFKYLPHKKKNISACHDVFSMVPLPYEYEIGLWMKSGGIHYEPTFVQNCAKICIEPSGAGWEEGLT